MKTVGWQLPETKRVRIIERGWLKKKKKKKQTPISYKMNEI